MNDHTSTDRTCGEPGALKGARRVREAARGNGPVERPAPRPGPTSPRHRSRGCGLVATTLLTTLLRGSEPLPATACLLSSLSHVSRQKARSPDGRRRGLLLLASNATRTARPPDASREPPPGRSTSRQCGPPPEWCTVTSTSAAPPADHAVRIERPVAPGRRHRPCRGYPDDARRRRVGQASDDVVRPAEQFPGPVDVAAGQVLADPGRRRPPHRRPTPSRAPHRRDRSPTRVGAASRYRPLPPRPNRKFSPDDDEPDPHAVAENLAGEVLRRQPEHRRVGGQQHDERGSGIAEQPQPVGEAGQRRRRRGRLRRWAWGWRSKVTAPVGRPMRRPAASARSSRARWPRCTPSNLPNATTVAPKQLRHPVRSPEDPETHPASLTRRSYSCVSSRRNPTLSVTW